MWSSCWEQPVKVEAREVDIVALGAQGDGIAETPQGSLYVPFALPGERVATTGEGLPELVSAPSSDRQAPICRHFGLCGGCVAQHMKGAFYAQWKRGIVVEAFRQHGLEPEIAPLVSVESQSRRRATLTARREGNRVVIGYHRRRSHDLLDLEECPVLRPDIVAHLPALRALVGGAKSGEVRVTVLVTATGLDVALETERGTFDAKATAQLPRIGAEQRLARLAVNGDIVMERTAPSLTLGGAAATPPPGVFVQAVAEAEAAMTALVVTGVGKAKRVVDLFCGVGTFTFALARAGRVLAVDGDPKAIEALAAATRRAQGLKPIETRVRDLFRMPLAARELEAFDAVVFDPPRAGAGSQAEQLARCKVPKVVAVSCNPATLARDARTLIDGGYKLTGVTPIDQFLFSAHVEAIALFERAG
jgi:23S rRNA (uracil1939-C5)-methyltransferase